MDGVDDATSSRKSARLLWVGASREGSKEEVLKDELSFRCWEERRSGLGMGVERTEAGRQGPLRYVLGNTQAVPWWSDWSG